MKKLLLTTALVLGLAFMLEAVPMTLRNGSMKSIPLIIPGYMNPNLSPKSNSGVDMKVGQKVYFKHKKKRYLLFVVSEEQENKVLKVDDLIRERKKELGL